MKNLFFVSPHRARHYIRNECGVAASNPYGELKPVVFKVLNADL